MSFIFPSFPMLNKNPDRNTSDKENICNSQLKDIELHSRTTEENIRPQVSKPPTKSVLCTRLPLSGNPSTSTVRFIDFQRFKLLDKFPRFPENADLCVSMESIDRNNSLIIFISHCWMRGHDRTDGYDGKPHPDNAVHDKFNLCVSGIERVKSTFAPDMKNCYLWFDFGCLNQDFNPTAEMGDRLNDVIGFCDCLFTPIHGDNRNTAAAVRNYYEDYQVDCWNGNQGYTQKAWCRLEMLCAANVPITLNSPQRVRRFKHGLYRHALNNIRPHLLYGTREMCENRPPIVLPPLQNGFYDQLDPMKGSLWNETDDRPKIARLVELLKPHMKVVVAGYKGGYDSKGQEHGEGEYIYPNGNTYVGLFKEGRYHGRGICYFSTGASYVGEFVNGLQHGEGEYTYADGCRYEGKWDMSKPQGRGMHTYNDGRIYDGEWRSGKMCGQGVLTYPDGRKYEGRFQDDKYHGRGTFTYSNGVKYNGFWRHGISTDGEFKDIRGILWRGDFKSNKHLG